MDVNPTVPLSDGHQMPLIGLGTLNFKSNDKHFNLNDFVMNAVKTGYTHFDINPGSG
jgi:diketogulonate reductase-like aldo/keto reductase